MLTFVREFSKSTDFRWLILLALAAFVPTIGVVNLFDWDEINFAESAREMMESGNYFRVCINYEPFWEKPPLFFWLQSASMHVFGINEFGARFPNALCGIITVTALYFIGKKEKDANFGVLWGFLYLCSFLPQVYFRSAIIDPVFNLFIFLSAYFMFKGLSDTDQKSRKAILSGLFCGLAVLTKGPVGFLLVLLTCIVYVAIKRFKLIPTFRQVLLFALMVLLVSFLWFGFEMINNGPWFLAEFIKYQLELFSQPVAGHQQPFYYHFLVVFFFTFPLSVFALPLLSKRKGLTELQLWMTILFWVVLILFTIVKTKIVHYSSMTYLPLSFLAASVINQKGWSGIPKYVRILFTILAGLFVLIFAGLPLFAIFKDYFLHLFHDPFAQAGFGNSDIKWTGFEPLICLVLFAAFVAFYYYSKRENILKGLKFYALLMSLGLSLTTLFIVNNIEGYSQRPMIDFYKSIQGEKVYVLPVGFKSYAQYFYFRQPQEPNAFGKVKRLKFDGQSISYNQLESEVKLWLMYDEIDHDAYFVSKVTNDELDRIGYIEHLYTKGGFKFYKRPANKN